MINYFSSWYWPRSVQRGELAEKKILQDIELTFKDVKIDMGKAKQSFMHCAYSNSEGSSRRIPVVMTHGLGAGLGFFYKNIQPLVDEGYPVFLVDWLGMGRSGRPLFPMYPECPASSTIDFFLDSFEKWREEMKINEFVLIGHSLGGYLSALYALKNPNRVRSLILSSPVGLPINNSNLEEGRILAITGHEVPSWIVSLWNKNYTPQSFLRSLGPMGPRITSRFVNFRFPNLPDQEKLCVAEYLYQISADVGSGEYALAGILTPGAWAREPLHNRLRLLSMPCHFVYGDNDWMDYRHAVEASRSMTVKTSINRVSNAGHHLYLENPEEYNRLVLKLLKEIK